MIFCKYFLIFMFYSILGWIMEVIVTYTSTKKLVNRGFLIGTYCPIYGWGVLLIMTILNRYLDRPLGLFCMAMIICSILEYLTSYIMEKLFKARWWDYSNRRFNLEGRICLQNAMWFGILGSLVMYYINPFIMGIINKVPSNIVIIITSILLTIFLVDNIISCTVMIKFRRTVGTLAKEDNTEEITRKIRERFKSMSWFNRRLTEAFPNLKANIKTLKKRIIKDIK